MKKDMLSLVAVFLVVFFLFSTIGSAQKNELFVGFRIPVQFEFQKENVPFPVIYEPREQKYTVLNYGIDILIEEEFHKRIIFYVGSGYFRNKFSFKKFYDHQLLNAGIDSIPIGTSTRNYVYDLIRFPVGISYRIGSSSKAIYKVGGEFIFNCTYRKIYNGTKPFPDANNKSTDFQYSGNSVNLFASIGIPILDHTFFELEPYLQVINKYKQDATLYEDPSKTTSRVFKAFGLSLKYFFNLKK